MASLSRSQVFRELRFAARFVRSVPVSPAIGPQPTSRRFRDMRCAMGARILILTGLLLGAQPLRAELVGNWDFGTSSLAAVESLPGVALQYLPDTPIYQAAGGPPDPPPLAFGSPQSFGITPLGSATTPVMQMPDMRGYGVATGLLASFPLMANGSLPGGEPATKLNRYSLVMDMLVPTSTFAEPPNYLTIFQPRGNADGALFVRKPSRQIGATVAYGGDIQPDTWHRIAMVMELDNATNQPRYETYVDGAKVGEIIWDDIIPDNPRDQALKDRDLIPDGDWSIAALAETSPLLPAELSGFFALNDNSGELGLSYVANLQFRSDALSSLAVAALGGPAAGPIPVPEPSGLALLVAAAAGIGGRWLRRN